MNGKWNIYDCHLNRNTTNFDGTEWIVDGEYGRQNYPGYWKEKTAREYYANGWDLSHPLPVDEQDVDEKTVYIVSMKEREDDDMDIWSTPFTSHEKADAFVEKVVDKLEKYGMGGQWQISIDSGKPDDEMYLDWIDARYEEYGEEDE